VLLEHLEDTDVRDAERRTPAERDPDAGAENLSGKSPQRRRRRLAGRVDDAPSLREDVELDQPHRWITIAVIDRDRRRVCMVAVHDESGERVREAVGSSS
jgi:hypothetical protein